MSNEVLQQVRAEVEATKETSERVAHDGLQPGSDGARVLAGLISQLAEQVERLVDMLVSASDGPARTVDPTTATTETGVTTTGATTAAASTPGTNATPNQVDTPSEEDTSPEQAPAEPPRPV